jgi:hypothetical protein
MHETQATYFLGLNEITIIAQKYEWHVVLYFTRLFLCEKGIRSHV